MSIDAILREFKTDDRHYFRDEFGDIQGEFKRLRHNGQILAHCYYVDGQKHGECKLWDENDQIWEHCYYVYGQKHGERKLWDENGQIIQHDIFMHGIGLNLDLSNITDKDKFVLNLKYGHFQWLPENNN